MRLHLQGSHRYFFELMAANDATRAGTNSRLEALCKFVWGVGWARLREHDTDA
jgi:hypothetical protein